MYKILSPAQIIGVRYIYNNFYSWCDKLGGGGSGQLYSTITEEGCRTFNYNGWFSWFVEYKVCKECQKNITKCENIRYGKVRTTFLHNHRRGGRGGTLNQGWKGDSAKYLDTTIATGEKGKRQNSQKYFCRTNNPVKKIPKIWRLFTNLVCFCNLRGGEQWGIIEWGGEYGNWLADLLTITSYQKSYILTFHHFSLFHWVFGMEFVCPP